MGTTDLLVSAVREEVAKALAEEIAKAKRQIMPEREVMEWLGIKDPRTLAGWRKDGLPCYVVGPRNRYYRADEVEDYISTKAVVWC